MPAKPGPRPPQPDQPTGVVWRPTKQDLDEAREKLDEQLKANPPAAPPVLNDNEHFEEFTLRVPKVETEHVRLILNYVLPPAIALFVRKSNVYGEPDGEDLGLKGQYADMHRKWKLLRRAMWEGQEIKGDEGLEERLMDMIGHCLKSIEFIREGR